MEDLFVVTRGRLGDWEVPEYAHQVVRVDAPTGGAVWIISEDELARRVLADPRVTKDPAFAPEHWRTWDFGLEPPGAVQPSLTTVDGEPHLRLRRAHAPLFTARRLREHAGRITEIARELLSGLGAEADLTTDFTARFPLTVICELLGVPAEHVDDIAAACRSLVTGVADDIAAGTVVLNRLVGTALTARDTAATKLRGRLPAGITDDQARYLLSGLVFAGQVTTEGALGFLIAHLLAGHQPAGQDDDAFVQDLRRHPPSPFTLWRFTTTEVDLDGTVLPPKSPILVNIEGINASHDLTFGAGAHFCLGAQLAQLELTAVARVLRADFPNARLGVAFADLPLLNLGRQGHRLSALPVHLI